MTDTVLDNLTVINGDSRTALRALPGESVNCCVTSPPYFGLRDYGVAGQIGVEQTPEAYVEQMVSVFREVKRVLRSDGTLWLNLGDSWNTYAANRGKSKGVNKNSHDALQKVPSGYGLTVKSLANKQLIGIPWRVALALQADGWYLRQDIIWHKPNPMPESVTDRCTKAHEYVFLLTKSPRYYFDAKSIEEPAVCDRMRGPSLHGDLISTNGNGGLSQRVPKKTRNKRSVWTVTTQSYRGAHFATYPIKLIEPCILAGSPVGGTVLDPFGGSGTTGEVALKLGRKAVFVELNPKYIDLIHERCQIT